MNDLLQTYDEGAIGFFESPTGTGKSMSMISSSIVYIQNKNKGIKRTNPDDVMSILNETQRSKVIFATRTHTQIKELVNEIKKISKLPLYSSDPLRVVSLASRQYLCINTQCQGLSASEIAEKCSKCLLTRKEDIDNFCNDILSRPLDIEDLFNLGTGKGVCPYMATRQGVPSADIIMVPYQSLFQVSSREALGINLKNSYIVVDEAHNLADAINDMYSTMLSDSDISIVLEKLSQFRDRRAKRKVSSNNLKPDKSTNANELKRKDVFFSSIVIKIGKQLLGALLAPSQSQSNEFLKMNDFQEKYNVDQKNVYPILEWINDRQIVTRICKNESENIKLEHMTICRNFINFFSQMGNTDDEGVVFLQKGNKKTLGYFLLNPKNVFDEVAHEASSIILVGGTLQPFEDLHAQLTSSTKIRTHTNEHVIPANHCLAIGVTRGPKTQLHFTHSTRQDPNLISSLYQSIKDLSEVVPGGMIVFFTSYDYLNYVKKYITQHEEILKKVIIYETDKGQRTPFQRYKAFIDEAKRKPDPLMTGAILFAVMKGKLSEGINFSDDYCRCVLVVGMPFADRNDPVLSQRMANFDSIAARSEGKISYNGEEFYNTQCMRVVNQSIGRSFRHIKDYAVVILYDDRYADQKYSKYLPKWILRSYSTSSEWSSVVPQVVTFFNQFKG